MDSTYSNNHLSPSSSELLALLTLSPPSPILSCSELSTSITSGDIPILLDGLDISIVQTFPSAGILENQRVSMNESLYDAYLSQSGSTTSIGTFGPVRKIATYPHKEPNDSLVSAEPLQWPKATFLCLRTHACQSNTENLESATELCNNDLDNPVNLNAIGSQICSPQRRVVNVGGTGSRKATTETHNARLQKRNSAAEVLPSASEHSSLHAICNRINQDPRDSTTAGQSIAVILTDEEPKSYSWLGEVKVGLSIDQEGFRSINPSFKFAGCITQNVGNKQQPKVAQFVPINKKTFHFHYAPFDGLPVLRRVSVNEDENYDYISREATLSLKSNGTYIIRGVEPASHSVGGDNRGQYNATDLHWEFVYKVDDRRVGLSRKLIDGEKEFTPLSFSCFPALLQPSQGKKINLVHVVKKSITARLAAEKLHPSELDLKLSKAPDSARLPFHDTATMDSNLHRRALSYGRQQGFQATSSTNPFPRAMAQRANHRDASSNDLSQSSRRRRASSAGEWKGRESQPRPEGKGRKLRIYPPIQKHIINPARLAQMLEETHTKPKGDQATQSDFRLLALDPRHYRSLHRNNAF